MTTRVQSPIVIVGSPRSGTTILGKLLASHPEVAYWEEPRPIWSQGHAWRGDDALNEGDLTPRIARRIDDRFARFLEESGRARFAEKTPSNCLRLRFIHALYPGAKIVHVIRDGRAVVDSMQRMLGRPPDAGRVRARLRETPSRDLPALLPVLFRDTLGRKLRGGRKSFWGPRPPGWREWLDLPPPVRLARQWRVLVETSRRDMELFPAQDRIEIRYESLVAAPDFWLDQIRMVTGLRAPVRWITGEIVSERVDAWKTSLGVEAIAQVETEAGGLLKELGYLVERA